MRTELKIRKRLLILLLVMTGLFALIGARIGELTLIRGEELTARAEQDGDVQSFI